tara:strand:- start:508 stop:1056 length:549 start_codon:yes stop_codon:yes gene_type:complete
MNRAAGNGFSLVETLVALLLITVGSVGLAGLQVSARQLGLEALQRTEAAALAADILERMRINPDALAAYATNGLGNASGRVLDHPGTDCTALPCTPTQWAIWDQWDWERALNGTVRGASLGGLVRPTACVGVVGRAVTVEIAWEGRHGKPLTESITQCGANAYGIDDRRRQLVSTASFVGER